MASSYEEEVQKYEEAMRQVEREVDEREREEDARKAALGIVDTAPAAVATEADKDRVLRMAMEGDRTDLERLYGYPIAPIALERWLDHGFGRPPPRAADAPATPGKLHLEVGQVTVAPAVRAAVASIDQTSFAMAPIVERDALPFSGEAMPPPPMPAGGAQSGETAFLPPIEGLDDPLPFDQLSLDQLDNLPDLTVEQYASLCVERALYPAQSDQVAQRYRVLTAQALAQLDDTWRNKFAAQGELQSRWQQSYAAYERWLQSRETTK